MFNVKKHISLLLGIIVLLLNVSQSSIIHLCLESSSVSIMNIEETDCCASNTNDHCEMDIEQEEDCDKCFDLQFDSDLDLFSITNTIDIEDLYLNSDFNSFIYISKQISLNTSSIFNSRPPPYFRHLTDYISLKFLRGPTSNLA